MLTGTQLSFCFSRRIFLSCFGLWRIDTTSFFSRIRHTADVLTLCVSFSFSQVTLQEVLGNQPPRAFRGMAAAEREQLFWALKAQTTAQRGQDLLRQQAPPVRFGPNRGQTEQPRPQRRARVLSAQERRERLAQEGRSSMDVGGGEVSTHLVHPQYLDRFAFVGTNTRSSVQSASGRSATLPRSFDSAAVT